MTMKLAARFAVLMAALQASLAQNPSPNIMYITIADLGWNDVSFHGASLVRTPVLNNLAINQGMRLEHFYTLPRSGPARASFLTGKYAIHTGLQSGNIGMMQEVALGEDEVLISDELRRKNYRNYMVGRWQAGHYDWKYTPTQRNFDTFLGSYGGRIQKYTHVHKYDRETSEDTQHRNCSGGCWAGIDFRNGTMCLKDNYEYTADLYRDHAIKTLKDHQENHSDRPFFMHFAFENIRGPINASAVDLPNCIRKLGLNRNVNEILPYEGDGVDDGTSPMTTTQEPDDNRTFSLLEASLSEEVRRHMAMVRGVDRVIGELVDELKSSGAWDNTLLIISSDGGGAVFENPGTSNWPLRGAKGSLWEGGVRVPALVSGGALHPSMLGTSYNGFVHMTDWLPTFVSAAGLDDTTVERSSIDGFDLSRLFLNGQTPGPSKTRRVVLLNLDTSNEKCNTTINYGGRDYPMCGGLIWENWKLVIGYQADNPLRVRSGWNERPNQRWLENPRPTVKCGSKRKRLLSKLNWGIMHQIEHCPYNGEPCLFNLARDPCETKDVKLKFPTVYAKIMDRLMGFYHSQVESQIPLQEDKPKKATPLRFDNCWSPWQGSPNATEETNTTPSPSNPPA